MIAKKYAIDLNELASCNDIEILNQKFCCRDNLALCLEDKEGQVFNLVLADLHNSTQKNDLFKLAYFEVPIFSVVRPIDKLKPLYRPDIKWFHSSNGSVLLQLHNYSEECQLSFHPVQGLLSTMASGERVQPYAMKEHVDIPGYSPKRMNAPNEKAIALVLEDMLRYFPKRNLVLKQWGIG